MRNKTGPLRVLVVGQTPPPFGGQAMMIQHLLDGRYSTIRLYHVRMAFSEDMDSVGRFAWRKLWVLLVTILKVWWARIVHRPRVLYYPPAGPGRVPVLRDIALLLATRWLFRRTVFHFHASGVADHIGSMPGLWRGLARLAYARPTLAIRTAPQNPDDGQRFGARRSVVVPNGVPDRRGSVEEHSAVEGGTITILFTGVLIPSKGVEVLLDAFTRLVARGVDARLQLMGRWGDAAFERRCLDQMRQQGIADRVEILGVKHGTDKDHFFANCDIFCFPSFFESESFGLVLVEAMSFAKPVVATRWRGIPSVVEDGRNGILVPVSDAQALADALLRLCRDPRLRRALGDEGRRIFEKRFTLEAFHQAMEHELLQAGIYDR
ncbi:MAG: glycosyltransferase family 4 protein [Flavobacteriales bacterium]|nr:glycosyltransferase family 4 protein [Flavobacteriales bacterium]